MKKTIILVLAMAIALSLAACGGGSPRASLNVPDGIDTSAFDNPSQDEIVAALEGMETSLDVACASADDDPNGKIGTEGGYTNAIYFAHSELTKTGNLIGTNALHLGTTSGGSVEVYATEADAEARVNELAGYARMLGDDFVRIGKCVIRISSGFTKTRSQEVANEVINAIAAQRAAAEETTVAETTIAEETTTEETTTEETTVAEETEAQLKHYVLNTSSMKIHYASCSGVDSMADSNKKEVDVNDIQELLDQGYTKCGICNPQ